MPAWDCLNGMVQVANMIELGQIRAGVVVGTESSRALVEATIHHLNADTSLSRNDIKAAFASLTIGSGSAAIVLCDRELSRTGNRLLGGAMQTATEHCALCQGGAAICPLPLGEGPGVRARPTSPLLMWTDSEALMREGVAAAQAVFAAFLEEMEWAADDIHKTFCHQVGRAHQRLLFESLGLEPRIDYATFEYLGNTGSVALPMTAAIGIENGHLRQGRSRRPVGHRLGINVIMLGIEWQRSLVENAIATLACSQRCQRYCETCLRPHRPLDQLAVEIVDRHAGVDHDPLGVDAAGARDSTETPPHGPPLPSRTAFLRGITCSA